MTAEFNPHSPTPLPKRSTQLPTSPSLTLPTPPRALLFDVFGTCVDWRTTVTNTVIEWKSKALNDATASLASRLRLHASSLDTSDWGLFAQEWRDAYMHYTRGVASGAIPPENYMSIDEHHHVSLKQLIEKWKLQGLWTDEDVQTMSRIWHYLDPWPDAVRGIQELNRLYWTCTLSNGNVELLGDMAIHAGLEWTHIFSASMWESFKPSPKVYLGAVEKLGLKPEECVMVAAHLADLKAAKGCGLRTVYVERPGEEVLDVEEARGEGYVDVWVDEGEEGFVTVAERLGVAVDRSRSRSLSTGVEGIESLRKKGFTDVPDSLP
ncbi:MAG: hypothetical protein M1820_001518 [Bogoriella megaspora]|nr:MAG: hypothetical protein M1820_001518 [Bogoriella megaspora]